MVAQGANHEDQHSQEASKEGDVTAMLASLSQKETTPKRNCIGGDPEDTWRCDAAHMVLLCQALTLEDGALAEQFSGFVIGCIMVAGLLVGVQTYESLSVGTAKLVLDTLDTVILAIFGLECLVKMGAEGRAFWRYFTGAEWRWNCFDFTIVCLCLEPIKDAVFGGAGSVSFLRMMRLARVAKILKKVPLPLLSLSPRTHPETHPERASERASELSRRPSCCHGWR
jgi:hypothetical protein